MDNASHASPAAKWLIETTQDRQTCTELFALIRKDNTVFIVNQANTFMKQAWQSASARDLHADVAYSTDAAWSAKCAQNLYYWVLLGVLRSLQPGHTPSIDQIKRTIARKDLQLAMLNCAAELVLDVFSESVSFPALTIKLSCLPAALDLWDATAHFRQQLEPAGLKVGVQMPDDILDFLGYMRLRIVEELAWLNGSRFYLVVQHLSAGDVNGHADQHLLAAFLTATSRLAYARIQATCHVLATDIEEIAAVPKFTIRCAGLLDDVLCRQIDLLFGQHLSSIVACCIYGVARSANIPVAFKRITQAMLKASPQHDPKVFQTVEVCSASPSTAAIAITAATDAKEQYGELRLFYNNIFLPRMQHLMVQSSPAGAKLDLAAGRLPLKSLSAQDMNARSSKHNVSRLDNMQ